jgi:hypothetical protein
VQDDAGSYGGEPEEKTEGAKVKRPDVDIGKHMPR